MVVRKDGITEVSIFNIITLLGGLALFLYGMRVMGDGLKEGSTDTLKSVLEKVTNNPVKGFLVGMLMTAIIQSSTATIVITSGLVGAGILTLHQSVGIILGANVGTTVTGQIIRLMDIQGDAGILNFYIWEEEKGVEHVNAGVGQRSGEPSKQVVDATEGDWMLTPEFHRVDNPNQVVPLKAHAVNQTYAPYINSHAPDKQGVINWDYIRELLKEEGR